MNIRAVIWLLLGIASAVGFGVVARDLAKAQELANDFTAKWASIHPNMTAAMVNLKLGPCDADQWNDWLDPFTWHYRRPNRNGETVDHKVSFFGDLVIEKQPP